VYSIGRYICQFGKKEFYMSDLSIIDLKAGLKEWAERHAISAPEFQRKMGYSYNHAYQILKGAKDVTSDTLGRIGLAYGGSAVEEILSGGKEGAEQ
jgi:predicted transcriptional regulator